MAFGSDSGDGGEVFIDVVPVMSQSGAARFEASLGTIKKAAEQALGKAAFSKVHQDIAQAARSADNFGSSLKQLFKELNLNSKEAARLIEYLKGIGTADRVISSATARARTTDRAAAITQRELLSAAARERIEIVRNEGRVQFVEAQKNLVQTREAGKKRILITQEVLRTIARAEKATGAVIASAARGTASVISKTFSGITSLFRRQGNQIADGLDGPLRRRERDLSSSFSRQEQTLRRSVIRQEQTITQLNQKLSRGVLGAISGRGIGLGIAGVAGGLSLASLFADGYKDAINYGEQLNKDKVLFGEFANIVIDFSKNAPSVLGTTSASVLEAAGNFGNLFRTIGIDQERAAEMSKTLVGLATDLSSFNNQDIQEVFTALSAGLVGESEPARRLGIDLSDAALRAEALAQGIYDGTGTLTQQQKALAAYALVLKQTGLAQGDFARTADEGANAARRRQAATLQLISTIEAKFIPLVTKVNVFLVNVLSGMERFIAGDVNPTLLALRDALKGAALGMAAVVAAKGAVEVFKLLGTFAKLALTPMGGVLIAAGLLGATFQVMMKRSEPFRRAIGLLADKLKELWDRIVGLVLPALTAVADFVSGTIIPAIASFVVYVAEHLLGAFEAVANFVTGTLLPPLRSLWEWLSKIAVEGFEWMREKAVAFFDAVRPLVQPAVDGFIGLAKAIRGAFSGDFSGLRSGATGFLSGVGTTIANIAGAIGKALAPAAGAVLRFFQDLFSGPNIKRYASAFLGFVEEVGRIIGSIVSSPIFIKAVVGLAAAAAVIAFKFIQGFTEGVVDHLDDIARLIGDALLTGLKFALSNPQLIVGAIALGVLVKRLAALFRGAGAAAGDGFLSGFSAKLRGAGQSTAAFFGGPTGGSLSAAGRSATFFKAQLADLQKLQNQLRILGSSTQVQLSPSSMKAARAEIGRLSDGLTEAQLRGLILRDTLKNVGVAALNIGKGALQIGKGLVQGLLAGVTAASKRIGPTITNGLVGLSTGGFVQPGLKAGSTFMQSFKASISSAKASVVQGFQGIGQAFSQLAQQQGVSVGRLFGQTVASAAVIAVSAYAGGKAAGATGGSPIFAALTAGLTGFAITGNPIIGAVSAGVSLIGSAFGAADKKAKEFAEAVKKAADSIKNELKDAVEKGLVDLAALADGLQLKDIGGLNAVQQAFRDAVSDADLKTLSAFGIDFTALVGSLQAADPAKEIKKMVVQLGFASDIGQNLKASLQAAFGEEEGARRFNATLQKIIDNIDNGRDALDGFTADQRIALSGIDGLIIDVANKAAGAVPKLQAALDSINIENTFFGLDTGDAGKVIGAVGSVDGALEVVQSRLGVINSQFETLFNQGSGGAFQGVIDSATIAAGGIGKQIQDALSGGASAADLTGTGGGAAGAQLRDLGRQFSQQLGAVLQAGTDAGVIVDAQTAYQYLAPVFNAMIAGVDDPATKAVLTQAFADLIQGSVGGAIDDKQAATEIAANLELALGVTRQLIANSPELQGIVDELGGAGSDGANEFANQIATILATVPAALSLDGQTLGKLLAQGFADGLSSAEMLNKVRVAAAQLANTAIGTAGSLLRVASPSKVFIEFGQYVAQGLAIGIRSTSDEVRSAVSDMVQGAVDEATGGPGQSLASALFGALTGSNSPLAFANSTQSARGAVTGAFNSFFGQVDSAMAQVKELLKKNPATLTLAQRDILGESATSLDITDVLGAQNVASITSALDTIARYGQTLLDSGTAAEDVAAQMRDLVAQLVWQAATLGFDPEELWQIVDNLGLSDSAIADWLAQLEGVQNAAPNNTLLGSGGSTGGWTGRVQIENNIYLPTGDPEAAALAVANRQASWLFG